MKRILFLIAFVSVAVRCASSSPHAPTYCVRLAGAGPESDARDPDAKGKAVLEIADPTTIRFLVQTRNLGTVIATHIHKGRAGVIGPMAHEINPGFEGDRLRGVATNVPPEVVADIERNPSAYYLKLHSLKHPGGAIRGQLAPCRSEALR
jgi:hypothetical protein